MVPPPSRAHLEKMAVAKRRRKLPVDPPTRVSRPSSPAEGQDHSQIRRRERTSCVKNRMREFRTSGSVRGGDGDIPTYSAGDLGHGRGLPVRGLIERPETGIAVSLQ